ncbi:polypyrimidine tract-binding protein 1 isoform X7 [Dermacentor silvarum]|uniref:polypyrimidine tract-binding protein 1 isoform X7 n=1 Tax=Dermacentor silvarum TaxID=543639 RepID=UPI0021018CAE|nr:polypyrimidine tract-binding protein 1 isoform X7 [Dermacentor silvarum]
MNCVAIMNGEVSKDILRNDYNHALALKRKLDDRGSDELLTQTNAVSNGTIMSPQNNHSDNNNDAKKVKLDTGGKVVVGSGKPSRVVHIRNIPNDATDTDIVHLGVPFGKVTNVLQLKGKNQAFLEMADESSAIAMVDYFAKASPTVRGRVVYVQFSNHRELKTDGVHGSLTAQANQGGEGGGANTVLRVVVDNQIYPVTLDLLHSIFSRAGKVLKIVTFTKSNSFQALIQFSDVMGAQAAKLALDGQSIYNACCTLRIEYSKLTNLNVKYNNDKSRDFTNPTLPTGDPTLDIGLAGSLGILASPFAAAGPGLTSPLTAAYAASATAGLPLGGFALSPSSPAAATALGMAGIRLPGQPTTSCVLLVSNLNEQQPTDALTFFFFSLFCAHCLPLFLLFKFYFSLILISHTLFFLPSVQFYNAIECSSQCVCILAFCFRGVTGRKHEPSQRSLI